MRLEDLLREAAEADHLTLPEPPDLTEFKRVERIDVWGPDDLQ